MRVAISFNFLIVNISQVFCLAAFLFFIFCLDAKEAKNQGQPDPSRRLSLPTLGKSRIKIYTSLEYFYHDETMLLLALSI